MWVCCIDNPIQDEAYLFCFESNPFAEHVKNLGYDRCVQRGKNMRAYGREDQCLQHLRAFRNDTTVGEKKLAQLSRRLQSDDGDRQEWKCGICDQNFAIWNKRLKHIGKHWEA